MDQISEKVSSVDITGNLQPPITRTCPPPRPSSLPYEPIPDNIPLLQKYLLDNFSSSTFNKCSPFPAMSTTPAHIHLQPSAIPYACHTPATVAKHWEDEVKRHLDSDCVIVLLRLYQ